MSLTQIENYCLCCLLACPGRTRQNCEFPEVPSYYEFLVNSVVVNFVPLENPSRQPISMRMVKETRYNKIIQRLATELKWDPEKIRLTATDPFHKGQPARMPLIPSDSMTLYEIIKGVYSGDILDRIYYELFDVSVEEIRYRRLIRLGWRDSHTAVTTSFELYLPRDGRISDLTDKVRSLATTDPKIRFETESKQIRVIEVYRHRIDNVMREDDFLSQLDIRDNGVYAVRSPICLFHTNKCVGLHCIV